MHADLQAELAFHLTGQTLGDGPRPVAPHELAPALLARYRDLSSLRHDFPLLLAKDGIFSLTELVEEALKGKNDKTRKLALRHEQEIRKQGAKAWAGPVPLSAEGELAHCDAALPRRVLEHAWRAIEARRAAALHASIDELSARLGDILAADDARSDAARSGKKLRASFGGRDEGIDFDALSGLLKRALPERPMAPGRRKRIEALLAALRGRPFGPFVFEDCGQALGAYFARLPELIALSKAIGAARLEAAGEYVEARHDAFFETCGPAMLAAEGLADFPSSLVLLDGARADPRLAEMLSLGMPVKVLVQFDDVLQRSAVGRPGFGLRAHTLAGIALSMPEVYVLQCCASQLYQFRDRVKKGLEAGGAALFSVFSGAGGDRGALPPYLVAAAAAESRAFPAFCFDPSAEPAARFSLAGNPAGDRNWPSYKLAYEDAALQRQSEELAFTLADFVACDGRYAGWFARVPEDRANGALVPAAELIAAPPVGMPDKVPYVLMADGEDRLHRVIVADELLGEAHRSLEFWRSLQARIPKVVEAKPAEKAPEPKPEKPAAPAPAAAAEPEKPKSDDPYIETPRCTTCEECVKINPKLFVYDANKQAHIADVAAGTYRDLVEAAESCQVSIIHPGKPRDPKEHGLEELIERAAPFL